MNINKIILDILDKRDIRGDENIEEFLSPLPKRTYDPFLLLNMKEGVDLILDFAQKGKKICIYGDYDADGVTSISLLKLTLDQFAENVIYYIPSRFDDGYGLNKDSLKSIYDDGVDLVITVDCGIVSFEEVEFAKELGMSIIITDHHSVGEKIPDCIVINPKQPGCNYPFKELAGCGVAFKLCQALQREVPLGKDAVTNILDIVAIGTIGDIVPLADENRTIVKFGLNKLISGKRRGLYKLCQKLFGKTDKITSEDISYGIVPHLNAAGRMDHAGLGVKLFITEDEQELDKIVDELIQLNKMRKFIQEETYQNCLAIYEINHQKSKFPIIVASDAHEGVTGIVAGKLKEYCQKPVAILTEDGDNYKGTSRSTESIDIYEILSKSRGLFNKFGGHKGACGFSIDKNNLERLIGNLQEEMEKLDEEKFVQPVKFDTELQFEEVSMELMVEVDRLEPFGQANEKPIFYLGKHVLKDLSYMGMENQHVRFTIEEGRKKIKCVYFNYDSQIKCTLEEGREIDVFGKLNLNIWKGRESLQFIVTRLDVDF